MYADREYAETYFNSRLHSSGWHGYSASDRDAALATATRYIDRLNFGGCKADEDQELQFPRGTDTEVPSDIKIACCEIAFEMLVAGRDPQLEFESLRNVSQGFSSVRKTVDGSYNHEHLAAGIVSMQAWNYLRPYLRTTSDVSVIRV